MLDQVELSQVHIALFAPIFGLAASTLLLIVAVITLRALSWRFIRRIVNAAELRRKWLVQSRNGLVLLGLVIIWGEELRTLALSIVALAVAFVVATKELILCITGSIIKTASCSFDIGDRIQIKDYCGDVIDHNLLATTLLEVGLGKHPTTYRSTGDNTQCAVRIGCRY
ncbi:MAG: small-conductance mechanosensitive channel [Paracoccaceae bacterium]|jgi:small-conductance mechanosensitive channel